MIAFLCAKVNTNIKNNSRRSSCFVESYQTASKDCQADVSPVYMCIFSNLLVFQVPIIPLSQTCSQQKGFKKKVKLHWK